MATVIVVSAGLLFWRLSAGPVRLDFLAPALESALSKPDQGYLVRFAGISLDAEDGLVLTASGARITSSDGTVLASSPEVRLGISRQALLRGVLAPSSIDLVDVRVRLYRTVDGSLRFTLADAPIGSPDGDAESAEFDASDFLREPDPEKSTGYLRRLRVSEGAVVLIDERSGTVWRAPGSNFSIARDRGQITAGLGTTIDAPGGEQRLDASGGLDVASGEAWLDLRVGGLRLARLAPLIPALEQARAIDMAFDATASARFDAEGAIKQARFRVGGRDGSLSLGGTGALPVPVAALEMSGSVGPGGDRITVEELSAAFGDAVVEARGSVMLAGNAVRIDGTISRLDAAAVAAFAPSIQEAYPISVPLEGDFAAVLSEGGDLDHLAVELRGTDGELTVAAEPVPVARLALAGSLEGGSGEIRVARLLLDLGGPVIEGSGHAAPVEGGWRIDGKAVARDVPVDSLDQLWPPGVAPGGRRWITENLSDGRVSEARLALSTSTGAAASDDAEEMSGSIAFEGVTARYWEPLPHFEEVGGSATFAGRVLDVELGTGRLGSIELRKGRVLLTGLGLESGKELGDIDVTFAGPLAEIMTVLDNPPLEYAKWLELDPAQAGGGAVVTLSVELPLLEDLSIEEIDIAASADLRDVSIPAIALDKDLDEADLVLEVDKTKLELSGEGRLGGMPMRLEVSEVFEGQDRGGRVQVSGVTTEAFRAGLGVPIGDYLAGPVPTQLTMTSGQNGRRTLLADFDLAEAAVSLPLAEWSKPAGVPGTATARLQLEGDRVVSVERFEINAGTGYATGSGTLTADGGGLERLELDRLRLGDRTDVKTSLALAADGTATIRVSGASVDVSPLMRGLDQPDDGGGGQGAGGDIQIDAKVEQVWIGARYPLLDVDGHLVFVGDTLHGGEARAEVGPGNAAHLVIGEAGSERRLRLTLEDAGAALRTLGWVDSLSGGRLEIAAAREIGPAAAPWRGKVESSGFRVSGAPLAARLLAAASFKGLADLSSQDEGISFDRLEAPFVLGDGRLELEPGRAYGGALGVTFFGSVDTRADVIDIAGTIVPAYALNRVLGSIPLLGNLLTGEEGGGLFAATYRASGPLDEPEISVNPLAALAPGFLRNLFSEIAGGGSGTREAATDPAAERFPGNLN